MPDYISRQVRKTPFLAARLRWLADHISSEMSAVLQQREILVDPRSTSILLALAEPADRGLTAAQLALVLRISHQLVMQRVIKMRKDGLIKSGPDPSDLRKRILRLTPSGRQTAQEMQAILDEAEAVFTQLFEEIGGDLVVLVNDAERALNKRPLQGRFS